MAVDPGGTTGVARGFFNVARVDEPSVRSVVGRAVRKSALKVDQVPREAPFDIEPEQHAHVLMAMWTSFKFQANTGLGIALPDIHLVFEDFLLNRATVDLAPVKVTSAMKALLTARPGGNVIETQPPAMAMTYATNARLKDWGVWTVAMEHGRDATRHLCLRVSRALEGE